MHMNPYSKVTHNKEHDIFESGHREALLDVFDYLTGNPNLLSSERFELIDSMMKQAKVDVHAPVGV